MITYLLRPVVTWQNMQPDKEKPDGYAQSDGIDPNKGESGPS